jgi:phosphoglycerate dehydrogenase-like enzyme
MTLSLLMLPPQTEVYREWARRLPADAPGVEVTVAETADEAAAGIVETEAAFGPLPRDLLARAARLRWLQSPQAAPPAGFYYPELIAHPVVVTNMREIFNDHLGHHIMALVLGFARALPRYFPQQMRGEWRPLPDDTLIHLPEATALIVGLGGIGAEAARLAAAFGITVIGTDARRKDVPEGVAEMHPPEALDALLPRADFVILTVPHTPQTERMMNRERFARMRRGAVFINIGRGMTTVLDDLVAALRSGQVGGAALDVFEVEPLPASHPLWSMPNVLITPHMAGRGKYLNDRRYAILRDNVRAMLSGGPLRNVVDKAHWF